MKRPVGVKDINENELYEGDKVRYKHKILGEERVVEGFIRYFDNDKKFKVITIEEKASLLIHHTFGEDNPDAISIEILEHAP